MSGRSRVLVPRGLRPRDLAGRRLAAGPNSGTSHIASAAMRQDILL